MLLIGFSGHYRRLNIDASMIWFLVDDSSTRSQITQVLDTAQPEKYPFSATVIVYLSVTAPLRTTTVS